MQDFVFFTLFRKNKSIIMFNENKLLIIAALLLSFLNADSVQLSSGFYHSSDNKDSIVVDAGHDKVKLELSNGSGGHGRSFHSLNTITQHTPNT